MDNVFPALEARFNRSKNLKRLGRILYHGFSAERLKGVRPYVEVTCTDINHDFDTFDGDEPVYTLEFSIITRDRQTKKASSIMRAMTNVYDDADLSAAAFDCVHMGIVGTDGPRIEDATCRASMTFELHISWKVKEPLVRQAI